MAEGDIMDARKILVVSDSHGELHRGLESVVAAEKPSTLIHLGDLVDKEPAESDDSDFAVLTALLKKNPKLRFVHVSGGQDGNGAFEAYVASRDDAYSGSIYRQEEFLMMHNPFIAPGEMNSEVKAGIMRMNPYANAFIMLYGHTHHQMLGSLDGKIGKLNSRSIWLDEQFFLNHENIWLINPGAFCDKEYCVVEKDGEGNSVTYKTSKMWV